ncbi:MAG: glycerol-3-phosphate 1-O-acyltransferase PlsY [Opitutaceae bacterium]
MLTPLLIAAAVGYLLGALPFGYLVARAKGVNIFEVGSKSPGATNVRRVLGSGAGNLVFFLDALKGAAAAGWPTLLSQNAGFLIPVEGGRSYFERFTPDAILAMAVAGLISALLGHSFSCFTKFRGGKGVATATGGLLVLMPVALLIAAAVWAAMFYFSRYVSLASICAALALPLAAWLLHLPQILVGIALVIGVFVIIRHRSNIQRLLAGTESKFARKPTTPGPTP